MSHYWKLFSFQLRNFSILMLVKMQFCISNLLDRTGELVLTLRIPEKFQHIIASYYTETGLGRQVFLYLEYFSNYLHLLHLQSCISFLFSQGPQIFLFIFNKMATISPQSKFTCHQTFHRQLTAVPLAATYFSWKLYQHTDLDYINHVRPRFEPICFCVAPKVRQERRSSRAQYVG